MPAMGTRQTPSEIRRFKGETVFDWEAEPSSERPTEFGSTAFGSTTVFGATTGYSALSAFSTLESQRRSPRRPTTRRSSNAVPIAMVLAFAVLGLLGLLHFLQR